VAVIGVGNVMLDIARYLISMLHVEEVISIARRGPGEVKFDKKELEGVASYLDMADLQMEVERVLPQMQAISQDPAAFWELIDASRAKMTEPFNGGKLRMRFLYSPTRILSSSINDVIGLEMEENALALVNGEVKAHSTGLHRNLDVDTIIFAIGDQVDEALGLPIRGSEFVKAAEPRYPVDGISYEVYEPLLKRIIPDMFVAGWARQASYGLVGLARKDGVNGARAVLQYLHTLQPLPALPLAALHERLDELGKPVVTATDIQRLTLAEQARAVELGLEEFKFHTNRDMLRAIGR
jgi:ferredoxin--NADP+ reductase